MQEGTSYTQGWVRGQISYTKGGRHYLHGGDEYNIQGGMDGHPYKWGNRPYIQGGHLSYKKTRFNIIGT